MEELTETLSDKMKRFENTVNYKLERKKPVIIRLDGKAFHTFTKGLDKPFDEDLSYLMQKTSIRLAQEIQNVKFIYSQSDEISILLTDWDKENTDCWYDYRIQKLVSVSSAIATMEFNKAIEDVLGKYVDLMSLYLDMTKSQTAKEAVFISKENKKWALWKQKQYQALFDSRTFNLEKEEVSNYFLYRYKDAKRNSIQALAQSLYSHKQLANIGCNELVEKMKEEKQIDFNELSSLQKVGFAVYKDDEGNWKLDLEVPDIYEHREYVERWL